MTQQAIFTQSVVSDNKNQSAQGIFRLGITHALFCYIFTVLPLSPGSVDIRQPFTHFDLVNTKNMYITTNTFFTSIPPDAVI